MPRATSSFLREIIYPRCKEGMKVERAFSVVLINFRIVEVGCLRFDASGACMITVFFMFCVDTSLFLLPRTIRGQNMKRCSSFEVSRFLISASFADLRDLVDVK